MVLMVLPSAAADEHWTFEEPEVFIEDVDWPVDLAFGRDGYLYFALLQEGVVKRASVENQTVDEGFTVEFPQAVWESGTETGFHSIALDPEFHANGVFYASYTSKDGDEWTNVLSRVTLTDEGGGADEEVLLERPGLEFHNGGRLMTADGHLWWTTGDATHYTENPGGIAQEDGNLIGKVLRLTMEGEPAEGNPWDDHAYTKGHRNVFGIAWDDENERAFITENGDAGPDYVQILEAGANYGWPDCEGYCDEPREEFTDPVWEAEEHIAPTQATWFRGAFWWGSFNQGDLYRGYEGDDAWTVENVYHYPNEQPAILGVTNGPDENSIWFSTTGEILRMDFDDHDDHPAQEPREEGPYWWDQEHVGPGDDEDEDGPAFIPAPAFAIVLLVLLVALRRFRTKHRRAGAK